MIGAQVLAKALSEGDVSKENLQEFPRMYGAAWNPYYKSMVDLMENDFNTSENITKFLNELKNNPGYPVLAKMENNPLTTAR
jgi:hypothetical protein